MRGSLDSAILIGELGGDAGRQIYAGRGTIYHYGYPTYGSVQPNVAAQWLFDEASGDIVDEVASLTLADTGTPTYSVPATGSFQGLSPGITFGNGNFFKKGSAEATLNADTGSVTLEIWFKVSGGSNLQGMFVTQTNANTGGYSVYLSGSANVFRADMVADDTTACQLQFAFTEGTWDDGNIHKLRVVWNRTTNLCSLYCDGIIQGSATAINTIAGKAVSAADVKVGTDPTDGTEFAGTIYEVRVSLNATNNSGGPGGG